MVEHIIELDFKIIGVVVPKLEMPVINSDITYKKDEAIKMCLLEGYNPNKLSTKDISKLQLAHNLNNSIITLFDFSKGLNKKEMDYFNNLFKKLVIKYNKKIIIVSRDIDYLASICDHIAIYNNRVIYHTNNFLDDKLYQYIDMPKAVEIIMAAKEKGINLAFTTDVNELIKDMYRRKNESKTSI